MMIHSAAKLKLSFFVPGAKLSLSFAEQCMVDGDNREQGGDTELPATGVVAPVLHTWAPGLPARRRAHRPEQVGLPLGVTRRH